MNFRPESNFSDCRRCGSNHQPLDNKVVTLSIPPWGLLLFTTPKYRLDTIDITNWTSINSDMYLMCVPTGIDLEFSPLCRGLKGMKSFVVGFFCQYSKKNIYHFAVQKYLGNDAVQYKEY